MIEEPARPPADPSALRWLVVIVLLANVIGIMHGLTSRDQILRDQPGLTPMLLNGLLAAAAVNVVSAVGVLRWRRWGAIGLGMGLVAVLAINVGAQAPVAFTLLSAVALGLVTLYLWPMRIRLR